MNTRTPTARIARAALLGLLLGLLPLLGAGCAPEDGAGASAASGLTPVDALRPPGGADWRAGLALPVADVTAVTASAWDEASQSYLVLDQALTQQADGSWQGTIPGLPRHLPITYEAQGTNGTTVLYTGETLYASHGASGAVQVALAPLGGITFTLPRVAAIDDPGVVAPHAQADVTFHLEGDADETLAFRINPAQQGGNFNPRNGSVTLTGTTGTLVSTWRAPNSAGTYEHTIEFTDAEGTVIVVHFQTQAGP